jgi:PAS domain S-box-containing protein
MKVVAASSEKVFSEFFNALPDAICAVGVDGRIAIVNNQAEQMFGYAATDLLGQPIEVLIPERFRQSHVGLRTKYAGDPRPRPMGAGLQLYGRRKDGAEFPVDIMLTPWDLGDQRLFVAVVRDISERKKIEEALEKARQELEIRVEQRTAALALERKTAVTALETRAQQQRAIAELGRHALEGRSFAVLLNDAVALVPQILGTEYCAVFELLSDDQLILSEGAGWKDGAVGNTFLSTGRDSQAGYTLLSHAPVVVEDLGSETRFRASPLQLEHHITSGISVLIHYPGKPFGVLGAYTKKKRSFSGDDVHFLQSIAGILTTAVGRRQLEAELLDASGREQRRLGQDLHDGLCQHLIGLQYTASVLAEKLEKGSDLRKEAETIAELIRQGTLQARLLARGLSPVNLEANGLMSALRELALNTESLFRITCRFECPQEVLVTDNNKAVQLYRIAQEAITNAVKHGRSTSVLLSLERSEHQATLKITDNGVGLPDHLEKSSGMGLRIMQYRSDMIGASLRIAPASKGGTEVTCVFDIDPR